MMSTEMSVLLAIGCVILGVVGTYGFTFFHESRKEQAARKQLAAILCIEMLQQAEYIVQCCTVVNRAFLSEPKELLREEDIRRYLPPPPGVYTSSLEKFGLLPNHVSSNVIKFHNELQKAKDQTVRGQGKIIMVDCEDDIPESAVQWVDHEEIAWIDGQTYMHDWASNWQGIASSARRVLDDLSETAGDALAPDFRADIDMSVDILQEMAQGEDVTILPDDMIALELTHRHQVRSS